jgi:hypothetical protein
MKLGKERFRFIPTLEGPVRRILLATSSSARKLHSPGVLGGALSAYELKAKAFAL